METSRVNTAWPDGPIATPALSRYLRDGARGACCHRVADRASAGPELFEVLRAAGKVPPFVSPLGIDRAGGDIWLDLHRPSSRHLLIEGGTPSARAETLRALTLGLAMTTRPALLQVLGIDGSGRELSVLDTLPHAAADTANDLASAQVSLVWLATELRARAGDGRLWPEMLLVVEDVMWMARAESGRGRGALTSILRVGGAWGMHVLGAVDDSTARLTAVGWSRPDVARILISDESGRFEFACAGSRTPLTGTRVSAADLDRIARGWRPSFGMPSASKGAGATRWGGQR